MDRLRPITRTAPLYAFLLGMGMAALWLYSADRMWGDSVNDIKLIMADGASLKSFALEGIKSFSLMTLALLIGISFALALAITAQKFGGTTATLLAWIGRLIADITPIAWVFGVTLLLARVLELPILGLSPDAIASQTLNWHELLGHKIWQWTVPAITLATPVFGMAFYAFSHQLSEWNREPAIELRARGLPRQVMFYRYGMLFSWQLLRHLTWPAWCLLLASTIPVEMMLGFDGWGRNLANALLQNNVPKVAASFCLGGVLLALGGFLSQFLEQRSSASKHGTLRIVSHAQNKIAGVTGITLMIAILFFPKWLPVNLWPPLQPSYELWWFEVSRAFFSSLTAAVFVFFYSFIFGFSYNEPGATKGIIPTLLRFAPFLAGIAGLLYFTQARNPTGLLISAVILYGLFSAHSILKEMYVSDRVLSARSLGRATFGVWRNHILPNLLPSLLHWICWNTANVLLIMTLIRFCVPANATTDSWGQQLQLSANGILESPLPAFTPAILLALWCLSFRLISRAFPVQSPSLPTSPFVTR